MNPNQRMPVMEEDGFVLWESGAIIQYLADKKPGAAVADRCARVPADDTLAVLGPHHWDPACATMIFERLVKKLLHIGDPDLAEIAKGEERFHRAAAVLDGHLKGREYIAGDELTVADFSIGAPLNLARPRSFPLPDTPKSGAGTQICRSYRRGANRSPSRLRPESAGKAKLKVHKETVFVPLSAWAQPASVPTNRDVRDLRCRLEERDEQTTILDLRHHHRPYQSGLSSLRCSVLDRSERRARGKRGGRG